jgi:hypothetical protein
VPLEAMTGQDGVAGVADFAECFPRLLQWSIHFGVTVDDLEELADGQGGCSDCLVGEGVKTVEADDDERPTRLEECAEAFQSGSKRQVVECGDGRLQ